MPAQFAFVLHTANPITGQRGELFGEVVVGMGEALVGNHPGRALSFRSTADADVEVGNLPDILCIHPMSSASTDEHTYMSERRTLRR